MRKYYVGEMCHVIVHPPNQDATRVAMWFHLESGPTIIFSIKFLLLLSLVKCFLLLCIISLIRTQGSIPSPPIFSFKIVSLCYASFSMKTAMPALSLFFKNLPQPKACQSSPRLATFTVAVRSHLLPRTLPIVAGSQTLTNSTSASLASADTQKPTSCLQARPPPPSPQEPLALKSLAHHGWVPSSDHFRLGLFNDRKHQKPTGHLRAQSPLPVEPSVAASAVAVKSHSLPRTPSIVVGSQTLTIYALASSASMDTQKPATCLQARPSLPSPPGATRFEEPCRSWLRPKLDHLRFASSVIADTQKLTGCVRAWPPPPLPLAPKNPAGCG
ncbi:uncharacterized protein LOC104422926 [Eucalyptus grandis]|uniref:uncharacterized protein LOC104422926 n=1 Tax=Eucalyptus grandis TaxID=71139 RepID=UPI00192E87C3|nr:uncharacterized protein LOC104422926 [Eucalyptus grandis]XP_039174143.1 uncharacterized protein LOC104422926 [Eucalyptus grandis]XP_039174144.1 uncharacterized protein LOC104422926 [Eucalyptus grandis]